MPPLPATRAEGPSNADRPERATTGGRAHPDEAVDRYLTRRARTAPYAHIVDRRTEEELELEPVEDLEAAETPIADRAPDDRRSQEARDEEEAEGAEPYFAPTDPVLGGDGREVVGGLEETSMDSLDVDPSTIDEEPGDEALAEAVRRELQEDALTSHLDLDVQVRRGIAFLRGTADDLEDTDSAAEVASRVPGIRQVVEQLATRGA